MFGNKARDKKIAALKEEIYQLNHEIIRTRIETKKEFNKKIDY